MNQLNIAMDKTDINLEDNNEFYQLFYSLWENKIILIIVTLIVCALCTVYLISKPARYEANTLIQIDDNNRDEKFHLSQFSLTNGGSNQVASQVALIQSRVILEPIINQLGLSIAIEKPHLPIIGHIVPKHLNSKLVIRHLQLPNQYLNTHLKLNIVDQTHYYLTDKNNKILLQGETHKIASNNGFSMLINEIDVPPKTVLYLIKYPTLEIVKKLASRLRVEELGDASNNQTGILQISLTDTDPIRLIKILNAIGKAIQRKSAERKSMETSKTLDFLNEQLPIIKGSLEKAEAALNQYRAVSGKIDIKIQSEQLMEQLENIEKQIIEANLYKSNLLTIYTKNYPTIVELDNKISELKKLKLTLIEQIKNLPASDQVAMNFMRDVKVKNDLYLIMLNKIQELRVLNSGTLSDIRILAKATIPDTPIPEQTGLLITASLILGLMFGCIAILVRKAFRRRINDPRWLEQNLHLPNLAIIPYSKQQTKNKIEYKNKPFNEQIILAEKNPRDLSIEALRSLRTSFQIMLPKSSKNIISIMGVSENVGKSFVSSNFAYLLAQVEKRVLLIDGDIRRGDLYKYFSVPQTPGLNEIINGTTTVPDAIRTTSISHLSFLSCGAYPKNPSELLTKHEFKDILNVLSRQFDYIIIDTAPILAVTDSIIIGALTDVNFLVVGSNIHQPEEILLTFKQLQNAGIKIHGTIFNHLSEKALVYGKYRYHYHSYYGKPLAEKI